MSYIYSGTAVYEANEIPVVTPRGTTDGFYPITGTYSTAANNTVFAVLSAGWNGGSYLFGRGAFGSSGLLMAGIECPISGCTAGVDFGFGTTQYYRDGAYYGGTGTGLTRDDFAQSSISSQRIYGVGFTQSGLNAINMGRAGNTSIYATQELIVYFSDQLGTTPRQALEQNLNSYYQSSNLPDYTSGFLADYPDAAAAYSVRQLSNTAIKCMRVRRAVAPFDEKDIGFTAGGDLDEAAIVAFGGSDVLVVSAWYDQSGQSNHATQITPVNQPQIYDGTAVTTLNGKPSVTFSGATFMTYTTWSPSSELSAFWVAQNEATTSSWTLIGPNNNQWAPISTSQFRTRINGFYTWAWSVASGAQYLAALIRDVNDDAEFHYNGNTSSTTRNFTDTVTLNALSNSSNGLDGGIQEVVFWSADQSSNRTAIETNIMTYYSIP
jgi:hypothetical protein